MARFVNRTPWPQQAALHYLASLHFQEIGPYRRPALHPAEVELPTGAVWIDGSHYQKLVFDDDAPMRYLPANAEIWGEVRGDGLVHGIALGKGFGAKPGQQVVYATPTGFEPADTVALIRYRLARGARAALKAEGAYAGILTLEGNGDLQLAALPPGDRALRWFKLEPAGGSELEIDGCALVRRDQQKNVRFHIPPLNSRPEIVRTGEDSALTLKYAPVAGCYGLAWEKGDSLVREWLSDNLERDFPLSTHELVKQTFDRGGQQHYTNVLVRPVFLAPGETKDLHALVSHDPLAEKVRARLEAFRAHPEDFKQVLATTLSATTALPAHTEPGRAYAYGIERMAAVVATNVVYPVRRFGRFTRHYTPGREYDSLYSWDSGFIGLGLLELDPARSVDNLSAYLTEPGADAAFVFNGSPVAVQIYQLQAIWNRARDRELLRKYFPGARRMHRFLAGRGDGSNTRTLKSGLLRPWDYFWEAGEGDDYPAQVYLGGTPLAQTTAPVITTAQTIRTARILREMAVLLGEPTGEFDADIAGFTAALQNIPGTRPAAGSAMSATTTRAGRSAPCCMRAARISTGASAASSP